MYELWARKYKTKSTGYNFEHIMDFYNEEYKYTALDTLDKSVYQEAMVVEQNHCILYVEFEKPLVKVKKKEDK